MFEAFDSQGWDQEDKDLSDGFFDELPRPMYWRMVVMPVKPREVSKGGIVLAQSAQDAQAYLNYIGKVVALGPYAGKSKRLGSAEDAQRVDGFPQPGEYVIYGRYTGQPLTYKGTKLLIINDDEILAVAPNPTALTIHFQ